MVTSIFTLPATFICRASAGYAGAILLRTFLPLALAVGVVSWAVALSATATPIARERNGASFRAEIVDFISGLKSRMEFPDHEIARWMPPAQGSSKRVTKICFVCSWLIPGRLV